jgi:carbonic anhydrase
VPSGSPDKPDQGGGGGGVSVPVVAALVATAVVVMGVVVGLSLWYLRGGAAPNGGGGGASPTPLPFGWGRFTQYNPRAAAWSYDRTLPNGPAAWGALTNASTGARLFPACAGDAPGARQSPVDLADDGPATRPQPCPDGCALARTYTLDTDAFDVAPRVGGKPGFAVVPRGAGVAEWVVDGDVYKLDSFHYHSPSEHTWNGERVQLEAHFVHVAADGRLAVFGILYPPSDGEAPNPWMRPFWDEIYFPNRLPLGEVNVTALLADALGEPYPRYFRYDGSLTTPPCGEGVKWHVAVSRAGVSTAQRVLYQYAINLVDNHRDTQPLAGREVRRYN